MAARVGERGIVHVFRPTWTEPDPQTPGQRRKRTSSTYNWRFEYRGRKYSGGDGYKTQREARDAGDKRMREVRAGLEEDPSKATFAILERILKAEAELLTNETSKRGALDVARRLAEFFELDRLQELTRERLIEYVTFRRAQGRSDTTTRVDLGHLKRAMLAALEKGLMASVPRLPKLTYRPRQQTIAPHELSSILANLPVWWVGYYEVAAEIGWRAAREIRSRKWTDVDDDFVYLDAEHSKTGKARAFPITERLRGLLNNQRIFVESVQQRTGSIVPWVFCRPDGRPLGDPRKVWTRALRLAGFGKIEGKSGPWSASRTPHDIRRSVLRAWQAMGEALDVRMALAGHDSAATHVGYVGGDPASLKAFAERVDERRRAEAEKVTAIRKG